MHPDRIAHGFWPLILGGCAAVACSTSIEGSHPPNADSPTEDAGNAPTGNNVQDAGPVDSGSTEPASSELAEIDLWVRSGQLPPDPPVEAKKTTQSQANHPVSASTCTAGFHTSAKVSVDNYVVFNPNAQSMWAGALVGTKGLADTGVLNPIGAARAPLQLVVTGAAQTLSGAPLQTQVFTMPTASLANYELGRRDAIGVGFQPAAIWEYTETEFHNFQQSMTDLSVNASWVSGSAAASLDIGSSNANTKLMIEFKQRYYDVVATAPPRPSAVFDASQSLADLASQAAADNPIGYVASVTYGRHIIMTIESSADVSTLRAAITANQNFMMGSASVGASQAQQNIINQSKVQIYTVGDDPAHSLQVVAASDKVAAMRASIGGRDPSDSLVLYGVPISYRVNYLKNNMVARIGLAEEFDTTVDSARPQATFNSAALICCSESQCGNNDQSGSLTAHPPNGCEFLPGTATIASEDTHCDASYGWVGQPNASQMATSCWSSHHGVGCSGYTRTHMTATIVCACN